MAFTNAEGKQISFECSDLIAELTEDIEEFGGETQVEVVAEERDGVTVYKDYWFADDDKPSLKSTEKIVRMTASALLELYKVENAII